MTREKTVSKVIELKGFTKERLEAEARKSGDALRREQERLESLEKAFQEHVAEFTERQRRGSMEVRELELFYTYFKHVNGRIEKQKEAVRRRQAQLDDSRKAVVEAHREQRLLERFRDRILRDRARESVAREQKESDERFLQRRQGK